MCLVQHFAFDDLGRAQFEREQVWLRQYSCPLPENPIMKEMALVFQILDSRRVLHPAPEGAWLQCTSQITLLAPF